MISKFYCDIRGTYNGGFNRQTALSNFVYYLNNLDESDIMYFSFVSSDNEETIRAYMKELEPYLRGSKVVFGNQYADNKIIIGEKSMETNPTKTTQVFNDLTNGECQLAYFADDKSINGKIIKKLVDVKLPNVNLTVFDVKGGIDNLNKLLIDKISNVNYQK